MLALVIPALVVLALVILALVILALALILALILAQVFCLFKAIKRLKHTAMANGKIMANGTWQKMTNGKWQWQMTMANDNDNGK